jgi:hypothetical protein
MDFRKKSETVKAYRVGDAPVPSWVGELFINHRVKAVEDIDGHFQAWDVYNACVICEGDWLVMFPDGSMGGWKDAAFWEYFEPVDEHARIA